MNAIAPVPLAAALTLIVCRWLPVRFEYEPNTLGIVSVATVQRYPIQQETFWAVFALALAALAVWVFSRLLWGRAVGLRRGIGAEALALCAPIAILWLPAGVGEIAALVAGTSVWLLYRGVARGEASEVVSDRGRPVHGIASRVVFWLAVGVVAVLLTSGIGVHVWNVANRVPDAEIAVDNFKFLGETGQHLAWANALRHGGFQGRDVFCLYGPLYDLGFVGFWSLVGKSAAAWNLYWALTRVVGWLALFALGASLVRHRLALIALPFLLPWVELRVGWALFAGVALLRWLRSDQLGWSALAGMLSGVALLYSQEYGAAIAIASGLAFCVRTDARAAGVYALGGFAAVTPLFVWYAAHGALLPMLRDVAQYPAYMLAGYAKLPFPALFETLPWTFESLGSRASLAARLGYAVPVVCLSGLLLALPIRAFELRQPVASLRRMLQRLANDPDRLMWVLVAVFGLISFRSAMGRSSLHRTHAALPAVALLVCVAIDRTIDLWRRPPRERWLAAWRFVTLALMLALGGLLQSATPLENVRRSIHLNAKLVERGHRPRGDAQVERVSRWVQLHTEPAEKVLFLPNDAAYYYLTDRPNPIRFVMGHQIVGTAHREEVLADLVSDPPRYIVWDHHALRVDDLSDDLVFGRAILDFIEGEYETESRFNDVEILRHQRRMEPALVDGW